jgi:hypothetical protein
MKEKVLKRLTVDEIEDTDPQPRNDKLRDAIQDNIDLNIRSIRLVNDSPNWRGWIATYEE